MRSDSRSASFCLCILRSARCLYELFPVHEELVGQLWSQQHVESRVMKAKTTLIVRAPARRVSLKPDAIGVFGDHKEEEKRARNGPALAEAMQWYLLDDSRNPRV